MFYDAIRNDHGFQYDPFKAIVAPRPIGWISTLSATGKANLAPYSFFNAVSEDPHYVVIGSGGRKHTLGNIQATGEFCCNLATWDLRENMNLSSSNTGEDEFELAQLTKAPCRIIKPPRVAESPTALECRLFHIVPLPDDRGNANDWAIIGRVVAVHIDDRYIVNGRVDTAAMKPIARMGYAEYATVETAWRMRRPD